MAEPSWRTALSFHNPTLHIHIGISTTCRNTHTEIISITVRLPCG